MKISDFDFELPEKLIAQEQIKKRDHSKLMLLDKKNGKIDHRFFYEIVELLNPGDILVVNNSKVFPGRLFGKKADTAGSVEILLNKKIGVNRWEAIGKNLKIGKEIIFENSLLEAKVIEKLNDLYVVEFNKEEDKLFYELEKIGHVPLPPYIKRKDDKNDKVNYQTVYASEKGSVAAPTAGLHFTPDLIQKIKDKGVKILEVTLHVGLGTFAPVKTDEITDHKMHSELYSIKAEVIREILKAKKEKRRVIAVGTTTTRVLEHVFSNKNIQPTDRSGSTNIFIYPNYKFKCIDALITNFHLPKSTLLLLISAFAKKKNIFNAYKMAIEKEYRFFSYGDAMLIY